MVGGETGPSSDQQLLERVSKLEEKIQRLVDQEAAGAPRPSRSPNPPLSQRERDIIQLVAKGETNREIARKLRLSPGTVRNYNGRIFRKLGVASRTQASVRAMELGLAGGSGGGPASGLEGKEALG